MFHHRQAEGFDRFRGRSKTADLFVYERFMLRRFFRISGVGYLLFGRPGFDWQFLADRFAYLYNAIRVDGYRVSVSPLFRIVEEAT